MEDIFYYTSAGLDASHKIKHISFLEKNGINIHKFSSMDELNNKFSLIHPKAFIVTSEEDLNAVFKFKKPIVTLFTDSKSIYNGIEKYKNEDLLIFFRLENDPIHTIEETIKLISNL